MCEFVYVCIGDKGNMLNVLVICCDLCYYDYLCMYLDVEMVKVWFVGIVYGDVVCYELLVFGVFNFVLCDVFGGGVMCLFVFDVYGKLVSLVLFVIEVFDLV